MSRLHLVRTAEGGRRARKLMAPGDRIAARHGDRRGTAGKIDTASDEQLVHLIFEADVVIVW